MTEKEILRMRLKIMSEVLQSEILDADQKKEIMTKMQKLALQLRD